MGFACTECLVPLPNESWGTISKWGLQFCLLISEDNGFWVQWRLSSQLFSKNSAFPEGTNWYSENSTNQPTSGRSTKTLDFEWNCLVVKSWLFCKGVHTFSSIFCLHNELSSQLQTPLQACTWHRFSKQKLWEKEHPKCNKDTQEPIYFYVREGFPKPHPEKVQMQTDPFN